MENETKYALLIIGVAFIALIAFNYDNIFTGGTITRQKSTTYIQERDLTGSRTIEIPGYANAGDTIMIRFMANYDDDLIQKSREKIVVYQGTRFKDQITYPRCVDTNSAICRVAEMSFKIPPNWAKGIYTVKIERGATLNGKYVTEILGISEFQVV